MSLTTIIRTAIIDNTCRNFTFLQIQRTLDCSRHKAKALYYAFLHYASEEFLWQILDADD